MVKVKISTYVKTLEALLEEAKPVQVKEYFADFLHLLQKNRQLAILPKILEALAKNLQAKSGQVTAQVEYGGSVPNMQELQQIEDFLQNRLGARKVSLQLQKNEQLQAGFLIETDERQFNLTLDNQVERLRAHLLAN